MIKISQQDIEEIKQDTLNGDKYLPVFTVEVRDEANDLVARVKKTIYIRKKQVAPAPITD